MKAPKHTRLEGQSIRSGQGPPPVRQYIYMYTHTDQENGVLTTIRIYWFTWNRVLSIGTNVEHYSLFYD